jgi:two-component system, NarL family, response regulator
VRRVTDAPRSKIRVVLVDDHPIVRLGLQAMLDAERDITVVGQAASGEDGVVVVARERPDVTVMDLRLPGMSGPEAIAAIRRHQPAARIIVLTTYDGDEDVYRAVQAGACGYLLKGTLPERVLEAIRSVHAGERLIAPDVVARMAAGAAGPSLSARESEVLRLVAKGLSNKEISAVLFVTEDTIKHHLKRIFAKLGASDRTEAALMAAQRGIIDV